MMNQESKRPVTIEDLFRVKRAERPATEFWTEFDRELREKQLAALVEKRPWWRGVSLSRAFRGVARYRLPLGATAVLAVTLLSIRDYHPAMPGPSIDLAAEPDAVTTTGSGAASTGTSTTAASDTVATVARESNTASAPTFALSSEATAPGELARMVPLLGVDARERRDIRPSERSIAENRAVAEAILGTAPSTFETRALPARVTPQEPLAQISNPSETRRHRFAAAFASASIGTSPAPTARVARRLSDEQLYDSIHRFGASGNSVSFKF